MFIDISEELFGGLSVNIVKSFYFVWVSLILAGFPNMVREVKLVYVFPKACKMLCHFIFRSPFFVLRIGSKVAVIIVKNNFNAAHVGEVAKPINHDAINLGDALASIEFIKKDDGSAGFNGNKEPHSMSSASLVP